MADNIADITDVTDVTDVTDDVDVTDATNTPSKPAPRNPAPIPTQTTITPDGMYNFQAVSKHIADHYKRDPSTIVLVPPTQLSDGAKATFKDIQTKTTLATCRLRIRNTIVDDKTTGELYARISISDVNIKHSAR